MKPNHLGLFWQFVYFWTPRFITKRMCNKLDHSVGPVYDWFWECARCQKTDIGPNGLKIDYAEMRKQFGNRGCYD